MALGEEQRQPARVATDLQGATPECPTHIATSATVWVRLRLWRRSWIATMRGGRAAGRSGEGCRWRVGASGRGWHGPLPMPMERTTTLGQQSPFFCARHHLLSHPRCHAAAACGKRILKGWDAWQAYASASVGYAVSRWDGEPVVGV